MEYVILALALVTIGAVIFGAAKGSLAAIKTKEVEDLKKQIADMVSTRLATKAANELEIGRRESLVNAMKAEIANLEKALAENHDPVVVRARLSKLLSNPE